MDSSWKTETLQETLARISSASATISGPPTVIVSKKFYDMLTNDDLSHLWRVGDIVTRDGTDEHEIVGIGEDMLDLICIKEPDDKWIAVGERDSNLIRRYSFVRPGDLT